jgi:hypothetical protein
VRNLVIRVHRTIYRGVEVMLQGVFQVPKEGVTGVQRGCYKGATNGGTGV